MKIIDVIKETNPLTFSPTLKFQIEIEMTLELLADMHGREPLDIESELASILGKELVDLLKGYKFCA